MPYAHPQGHVFYRKLNHPRPMISHGEGIYLWDTDGKRYIDGSGGPLVINVGHGRQEIVAAMARQAEKAAFVHPLTFTSQAIEDYCDALAEVVPLPDPRFYFLSSGSEVVEGAIKLARQIQMARGEGSRHLIISRWQSYHGMTLGALSVSGRAGLRTPYLPMMQEMPHVAPPYPYRANLTGEELAGQLEATIQAYGAGQVAAFLAEPISGASLGAVVPPDDYWPAVRRVCDRYGVLLIADEVLVGMGRTGAWWGLNHWQVVPDIMVTSKGLAGGYFPFGFVATGLENVERIRQKLGDFNHGGTFSHHTVGAAAGLATLNIIHQENLIANSAAVGAYLGQKLYHTFSEHPHIGDIRGKGLFWGLEFVQDRATKTPFPAKDKLNDRIRQRAFDNGLMVYYSQGCADGVNGDIIMLGPPLIVTREQVDEMVELLAAAVQAELGQ